MQIVDCKEVNQAICIFISVTAVMTTAFKVLKAQGMPNDTGKWRIAIWAASWQNQQNGMCAQRRLRSAWASAQSDHQPGHQPGHPPSLIRVFAVRMKKAWVLSYPLSAQQRLIRLGRCPGWSVFAGRTVILLVLSWGGSFVLLSLWGHYIYMQWYQL